ncbi:MAG: MarR family transcriptional regulator [Nitrososphaeraceae archaeon]|jgi:MarR family transcriptional regulator for hemolysin
MPTFDYETNPGFVINRTARSISRSLDIGLRNRVGITFAQWRVLVLLTKTHDGLSQKEIADGLGLEAPSLIPILDKLQNDGFIERRVDRNDRRSNRIYRSKKTFEIWETTLECATRVLTIALAGLSEDKIQIMKEVLEKMWINLQANIELSNKAPTTITDVVGQKQELRETTPSQQQV